MTPDWKDVRLRDEAIANMFEVPAHLVTSDLAPGYWQRQLGREVARRRIRVRVRTFIQRLLIQWLLK